MLNLKPLRRPLRIDRAPRPTNRHWRHCAINVPNNSILRQPGSIGSVVALFEALPDVLDAVSIVPGHDRKLHERRDFSAARERGVEREHVVEVVLIQLVATSGSLEDSTHEAWSGDRGAVVAGTGEDTPAGDEVGIVGVMLNMAY